MYPHGNPAFDEDWRWHLEAYADCGEEVGGPSGILDAEVDFLRFLLEVDVPEGTPPGEVPGLTERIEAMENRDLFHLHSTLCGYEELEDGAERLDKLIAYVEEWFKARDPFGRIQLWPERATPEWRKTGDLEPIEMLSPPEAV